MLGIGLLGLMLMFGGKSMSGQTLGEWWRSGFGYDDGTFDDEITREQEIAGEVFKDEPEVDEPVTASFDKSAPRTPEMIELHALVEQRYGKGQWYGEKQIRELLDDHAMTCDIQDCGGAATFAKATPDGHGEMYVTEWRCDYHDSTMQGVKKRLVVDDPSSGASKEQAATFVKEVMEEHKGEEPPKSKPGEPEWRRYLPKEKR